ncbi:MAG: zinc dependent phospholipase C family protein [Coriobacteriales bacterium]|jgi:hypothetical protein|nr:zinc dependent phospholipase C family protein [Coriobacteriales bacterium]
MPALLTHDYFGQDVLRHIDAGAGFFVRPDDEALVAELHRAFLLGCQGPDPLFFALRTPCLARSKRFGSRMHKERAAESIEVFRRIAFDCDGSKGDVQLAYLLGFICHFVLDSTMHPLVYSFEYALCDAGVGGLDRRDGSIVHGQIEADLDAMMLRQRYRTSVRAYNYTLDMLKVSDETLTLLDAAYRAVAHEVYAVRLAPRAFSRGVRDMRLTIAALYSPRGVKRRCLGAVERLFRRHSLTQALSLRADVGVTCDFDNHEHAAWTHPFSGAVSCASFDELYQQALATALASLEAFMADESAASFTGGLNFEGAGAEACAGAGAVAGAEVCAGATAGAEAGADHLQ